MKSVLITGAEGFVAKYLYEEIKDLCEVRGGFFIKKELPYESFYLDVTDHSSVNVAVRDGGYDAIYHLAGQSSAKTAKTNFFDTYRINVLGALNIAEAVTSLSLKTRVIFISTSDVYGVPMYLPVDEKHPVSPLNAYSHSKLLSEEILRSYAGKGLDLVIARSFNHTGRGQTSNFFIPSMVEQVLNAENGGTIYTGDLSVKRDFSDVRDIVRAYRELLNVKSGLYNVSSGKSVMLKEILDYIIRLSGKEVHPQTNGELLRKGEPSEFVGSSELLRNAAGWMPKRNIFETIEWMMNDD